MRTLPPLLLAAACGRVPAGAERVREDPAPAVLAVSAPSPDGRVRATAGRWGVRRRGAVEEVHHRLEVGGARLDLYARGVSLRWRDACTVRWLDAEAVRFACDAGTGEPLETLAITWSGGAWIDGEASAGSPVATRPPAGAPAWIAESVVLRRTAHGSTHRATVLRWRTPDGDLPAVRLEDGSGRTLTFAPGTPGRIEPRWDGPDRLSVGLPDGSRLAVRIGAKPAE